MAEATSEFCFLYSTYPDSDTAMSAARLVVDRKLAACVNVYPKMMSVYNWQGQREESPEFAVFIKTRRTLVEAAIAVLWPVHSYSVPCFVVLPIEAGTADYLAWARAQTEQPTIV
jgi:periplasmic divalent cation tolerance protein